RSLLYAVCRAVLDVRVHIFVDEVDIVLERPRELGDRSRRHDAGLCNERRARRPGRLRCANACDQERPPDQPGWPGGETAWAGSGGTWPGTFVPCVTGRFLSRSSRVAGES